MSQDDNFAMARQFRYLHTRVMLHLQDELRQLEAALFRMDERDRRENPFNLTSRVHDDDHDGQRRLVLDKIREKLREYSTCLPLHSAPALFRGA